jgi:hypothetical protein
MSLELHWIDVLVGAGACSRHRELIATALFGGFMRLEAERTRSADTRPHCCIALTAVSSSFNFN